MGLSYLEKNVDFYRIVLLKGLDNPIRGFW